MTIFWICALALLGLAAALILRPLLGKTTLRLQSVSERNIAIAKERRNEIESSFEAGDLSEQERDQALSDLEIALALELSTAAQMPDKPRSAPAFTTVIILLSIPVLALSLYWQTGTIDYQRQAAQGEMAQDNIVQGEAAPPSLEQLLGGLEARIEANPDDERGLFLLGQTYSRIGRHEDASAVYGRLLVLTGPNADLLAEQADAMVMANQRQFNPQSIGLLAKAIDLNPHHLKARWLAGLAQLESGQPAMALEHWLWAQGELENEPDVAAQLTEQLSGLIDQAMQQLGDEAANSKALVMQKITAHNQSAEHLAGLSDAGDDSAVAQASLRIAVELGEGLQGKIKMQDTVFIIAKAKNGPQVPLAVERITVADLPLQVILDDSKAMLSQMTISGFADIVVSARISASGNPIAQAGDIQSNEITVSNRHSEVISLTLSELIK